MILILVKLFLNSKLDLIQTVEFVKQLLRIQIRKVGKVLLWNQVKSRMNACYSELVLNYILLRQIAFKFSQSKKSSKNCSSLQSDTKWISRTYFLFFKVDIQRQKWLWRFRNQNLWSNGLQVPGNGLFPPCRMLLHLFSHLQRT